MAVNPGILKQETDGQEKSGLRPEPILDRILVKHASLPLAVLPRDRAKGTPFAPSLLSNIVAKGKAPISTSPFAPVSLVLHFEARGLAPIIID